MAKTRFDVTAFGEIMLRLSVSAGNRLEATNQLRVDPAGAESNVMGALARLNRNCAWVGGLPASALGRLAANSLRLCGVNLESIIWSENERIGTYYVEFSEPPRSIEVLYDRANSSAALLTSDQIDWDFLLNTRLLHLTGITPALSANSRTITRTALARARAAQVPVSFDINYRQKLWEPKEAAHELTELIQKVEILFCSKRDAERLFGITGNPQEIARQLSSLSGAKHVVVTLGESGAALLSEELFSHQPSLPTRIVDRLGAGDALAAGVIHGWLDNNLRLGLRYGTALAALALSQHGDMVITTADELKNLSADSDSTVSR